MAASIMVFYASAGMAGAAGDSPVTIDLELMNAQGVQASARFSDNDVEVIGCGARVTDSGNGEVMNFGFCQATDAAGVSTTCFTFSPDLVAAINSIANYGFISFTWNDLEECTSVRNSTQSLYIPDFRSKTTIKSKQK